MFKKMLVHCKLFNTVKKDRFQHLFFSFWQDLLYHISFPHHYALTDFPHLFDEHCQICSKDPTKMYQMYIFRI
jgi:hypothetical protein